MERRLIGIALCLAAVIMTACGPGQTFGPTFTPVPTETATPTPTPDPCDPEAVTVYLAEMKPPLQDYLDASQAALDASASTVSRIITDMQDAQGAFDIVEGPPCSEEFKKATISMMDQGLKIAAEIQADTPRGQLTYQLDIFTAAIDLSQTKLEILQSKAD